jgi:hypothetical protein
MKKLLLLSVCAIFFSASLFAQISKKEKKEQKKEKKEIIDDLKTKAIKEARKEEKRLVKEGFKVIPGGLPMAKQLENIWIMQSEKNDEGIVKYLVATGNGVAKTQTAAKLQAIEMAKLEMAGKIETNVAALIDGSVATKQLTAKEAESLTEVTSASTALISQSLIGIKTPLEIMKDVGKENVEVQVKILCDSDMSEKKAKKAILEELKKKTEIAHDKLDRIMGLTK